MNAGEHKIFFSEEKKQKTFASLSRDYPEAQAGLGIWSNA